MVESSIAYECCSEPVKSYFRSHDGRVRADTLETRNSMEYAVTPD